MTATTRFGSVLMTGSAVALLGLFLTLGVASATPAAVDAAAVDAPLLRALGASCDVPSVEALLDAAPDAAERLYAIALDETRSEYVRERAVSLLSGFPDEETEVHLAVLMEVGPARQRAIALYVYARTFGAVAPDLVLARVVPRLDATEPRLRDLAIRALAWVEDPAARIVLERFERETPRDRDRRVARHALLRRPSGR